ncbi:MAG: D-serine ammonia-lyase [Motiliproteus sp.]
MPTATADTILNPILRQQLLEGQPTLWLNARLTTDQGRTDSTPCAAMRDAELRLARFAPLLAQLFPELQSSSGLIESELRPAPALGRALLGQNSAADRVLIKCDHALPVAGSVKARGGIYEVLCFAEQLALKAGIIQSNQHPAQEHGYLQLAESKARTLFSRHRISVGSTGNLGLSIGIMAAQLGFQVSVHMSRDAKEWKKKRLRDAGVEVVEHSGDYAAAVAEGRRQSEADPCGYFVDDENSERLFYGYSVAALRLQRQLQHANIPVDNDNPLFVYLPCGVGGAPGGISYGLKQLFGDNVHCFFAEPVQAPCMLYAMAAERVASVSELGLSIATEADGLAVGCASELVAKQMSTRLSGIFTVTDEDLLQWVYLLHQQEGIDVEPSATAGFAGPALLTQSQSGHDYLRQQGLEAIMDRAHHIVWTTGGNLVPAAEQASFIERGRQLFIDPGKQPSSSQ